MKLLYVEFLFLTKSQIIFLNINTCTHTKTNNFPHAFKQPQQLEATLTKEKKERERETSKTIFQTSTCLCKVSRLIKILCNLIYFQSKNIAMQNKSNKVGLRLKLQHRVHQVKQKTFTIFLTPCLYFPKIEIVI